MDYNETLNAMTLARLSFYNLASIMLLYRQAGSATAVIENSNNIRDIIPDASQRLVELLRDCHKMRGRAEEELEFDLAHGIKPLDMSNPEYPHRLVECDDAPLVLYYKGNTDLIIKNRLYTCTVKCTCRFISKYNIRIIDESPYHSTSLCLTA